MDTLARLTEEELVPTEVTRLDPCCKCVAAFAANHFAHVNSWNVKVSTLEVSCSSWARSVRSTAFDSYYSLLWSNNSRIVTPCSLVSYNSCAALSFGYEAEHVASTDSLTSDKYTDFLRVKSVDCVVLVESLTGTFAITTFVNTSVVSLTIR